MKIIIACEFRLLYPVSSYITLGNLFPVPQFSHLKNRDNNGTHLVYFIVEIERVCRAKLSRNVSLYVDL